MMVVQKSLLTVLEGFKKFSMRDEDWEEMDLRAATAIMLNLVKNFLHMCMEVQQPKSFMEET